MAVTSRRGGVWGSRLHFLIRFLGLTGLMAGGAGVAILYLRDRLHTGFLTDWQGLERILFEHQGARAVQAAVWMIAVGGALAVLFLLVDLFGLIRALFGRRGASGLMSTIQIGLAAALLVCVNWYSFKLYKRFDLTRSHEFTLPADVEQSLRRLRGETTVVVYQRHKTFSVLNDKPDAYDYAAERKVVEKVKDLVDEIRELGPRFQVVVLDVEEEGFQDKLEQLTKAHPELKPAIDSAGENSIFFLANGRLGRLGFNEFYQLDKKDSKLADGGRGNLVLLPQGKEVFARRIVDIEGKRPKVGVLVIHELLTSMGSEDLGLVGFKKALAARGFDVKDIVLKKWSRRSMPESGVLTYDESKFERLDARLAVLNAEIPIREAELADLEKIIARWSKASLDDLTKDPSPLQIRKGARVTEPLRKQVLEELFEPSLKDGRADLDKLKQDRAKTQDERGGLNVDSIAEVRRISDLKDKLERALADCDMIFVPRLTVRNLVLDERISPLVHRLDDAQVDAIKGFLAKGKPILATLGPASETSENLMNLSQAFGTGADKLEAIFSELGVRLNSQTIISDEEGKALAERQGRLLFSEPVVDVPPVEFAGTPNLPGAVGDGGRAKLPPSSLLRSVLIAANSLDHKLDLNLPSPRPLTFEPPAGISLKADPGFLKTSSATWNENDPFASEPKTPRYEPSKPGDKDKGTFDEKRRGPFPIGVAAESLIPKSWYASPDAKQAAVRMVVIGSGSIFVGPELSPAKELLLPNSCNWLLGRDDLLPADEGKWSYPRVHLSEKQIQVWHWGAFLAMPLVFAYFGLVILLRRRVR